jgi:uncharacterized lipoprotein NlpE involved in copper resistance
MEAELNEAKKLNAELEKIREFAAGDIEQAVKASVAAKETSDKLQQQLNEAEQKLEKAQEVERELEAKDKELIETHIKLQVVSDQLE